VDKLVFKDGNHLSHAYIVSAASEEARNARAQELAQALVCSGEGQRPCFNCRDCRKAAAGIHPDIILVERQQDDSGGRKKEIYVDQVRYMVGDSYVLPNEAARKVYIVHDADTMNPSAQNAALKLLEEPPASAAFILCAANAEKLLPTVRSRCVEMHINAQEQAENTQAEELAKQFLQRASAGDRAELLKWCAKNESMDVKSARDFVDAVCAELADMLCMREPLPGIDRKSAAELLELMARCRDYLGANTGVKHIFGLLAVDAAAKPSDKV